FVLNLIEQPHVLNRDYRLIGERTGQFHLLWRERSVRDTGHPPPPNGSTFPHERDGQQGSVSGYPLSLRQCVFGVGENVGDVYDDPLKGSAPGCRASPRNDRMSLQEFLEVGCVAVTCELMQVGADEARDGRHIRLAKLSNR